jgi:hypothetical protein
MMKNENAVRLAMHGRILRCPLGGNPPDCPLYEIRQKPLAKRMEWLKSKTDLELFELFEYHIKCLAKKTGIQSEKASSTVNASSGHSQ